MRGRLQDSYYVGTYGFLVVAYLDDVVGFTIAYWFYSVGLPT